MSVTEVTDAGGDTLRVIPIRVAAVKVVDRHRRDLGDLRALADSIAEVGLINAVTVTGDLRLIAGERRLRAFELLGRGEIPAHIVYTSTEARDVLVIERDENTQRKAMLPSEAATLGLAIEEIERPQAEARRQENQGRPKTGGQVTTSFAPKTRDVAAEAIGMSEPTYRRIKQAMSTAADEAEPVEVRQAAQAAVAGIDAGKRVAPQVKLIAEAREALGTGRTAAEQKAKWARISELADNGATSPQVARQFGMSEEGLRAGAKREGIKFPADKLANHRRIKSTEVLEQLVLGLEVTQSSLGLIALEDITPEQAATSLERLAEPLRALNKLRKALGELKEIK